MGMGMGMDTNTPRADAAVIIPHYDNAERPDRCLCALMANDRTGVEIIVVDNGSPARRTVFACVTRMCGL